MAQATPGPGVPPTGKRRRGGCLGCFIPLLLIVALVVGGFYFLVVNAAAEVSVPAQLVVLNPATSLTHAGSAQPATSGALVFAGDDVRTDATGRSLIQFQDGSITRLAPGTELSLTTADFDKQGRLSNVSISQKAGRTMNTVQKLVNGNAHFNVAGHSANASVRGTKFEVVTNPDGSMRLKVYIGLVNLAPPGQSGVNVAAGQQADASPNGTISSPVGITADPADPFTLWMASEEGAKAAGQPATAVTSFDQSPLGSGQTAAQPDYETAGGEVIGLLAYPGSAMTLSITDPAGIVHESSTGRPGPAGKLVIVDIPNAPGGAFKIKVRGDSVAPAEHYTVTLITKFSCGATQVAAGGFIRNVMSANDTRNALVQSGGTKVSVTFNGASAGGANIGGSGSFSGVSIAAGALLYAAGGGNIGVAVTAASINGFDVKQQITSALAQAGGRNLTSLPIGFRVDRIYTCSSGIDSFLVIEGKQ